VDRRLYSGLFWRGGSNGSWSDRSC
jgi:hypothetical protein